MRNLLMGFICGVVLSGAAWVGASTIYQPSPPQSRPDQLWEHDRGAAIQQYLQQRQQDVLRDQQLRKLQHEEELKQKPC